MAIEPTPHSEDRVVEESVAAGMAATEQSSKTPWLEKLMIVGGILVVFVGTTGGVLSAINTLNLRQQNKALQSQASNLKKEQDCTQKLLATFETDAKARNNIASADRLVILTLVEDVATAKNQTEVTAAFTKFKKQSALNDARRAKYPISTAVTCPSIPASNKASSLPSIFPAPSTSTVTIKGPTPSPSPGVTVANQGNNVTTTRTVPGPTRTVTRTRPVTLPPVRLPPITLPPIPISNSLVCQILPTLC